MLNQVVALNNFLGSTYLPTLLMPLTPCLHAFRVSLAYRAIRARVRAASTASAAKGEQKKGIERDGWLFDVAGFLVMAWGGSFLVASMTGSTPLQLLNIQPLVTYVLIHVYTSLLVQVVPFSAALLDTVLPLIDGATRTAAIAAAVRLAARHSNPLVAGSLLFQIIAGTLAASGGGQLAGTLSVFNPSVQGWSFTTPPFLKARNFVEAADVVAAAMGAAAYSCFSGSHPAWLPILSGSTKYSQYVGVEKWGDDEARAAATVVVGAVFALRAVLLHWTVKSPKTEGQRLNVEGAKQDKKGKNVAVKATQ